MAADGKPSQIGPPGNAQNPSRSRGGVGGGLPSDLLSVRSLISAVNPDSVVIPIRGRARVKPKRVRVEPAYTPEFEVLWAGCDRSGAKLTAFEAWQEVGSPEPKDVIKAWGRYRASIPEDQAMKHLSSWLRAFCHRQEWLPRQPRATGDGRKPAPVYGPINMKV